MSIVNAPKGVMEYLPPDSAGFTQVRDALLAPALSAGYSYAETPVFEHTELFVRGVGQSTDVVSKEMFTFEDRGGRSLTLRPELTAGVMRAVIEHGLDRGQLPVKLATSGQCFRAERPQAGRGRQFSQVNIEAIGVDDPALDAEVIALADEGFRRLGLQDYSLHLTSLGDADCRPAYRERLVEFLDTIDLDDATRERAKINPLRVLDDKRDDIQRQLVDAPLMLDHLSEVSAAHFAEVRQHLDALGIKYQIDPRLVRGLDYYTKTTFEFIHNGLGSQSAVGGGGRYDGLMAELGGQPLSGIGWGLGIDRTLLACRAEGLPVGDQPRVDVYLVPLGEAARAKCVLLAAQLRGVGVRVDIAYGGKGIKASMKGADRSGARHALILGERDIEAGVVQVKDMASGEQQEWALEHVVPHLRGISSGALEQGDLS